MCRQTLRTVRSSNARIRLTQSEQRSAQDLRMGVVSCLGECFASSPISWVRSTPAREPRRRTPQHSAGRYWGGSAHSLDPTAQSARQLALALGDVPTRTTSPTGSPAPLHYQTPVHLAHPKLVRNPSKASIRSFWVLNPLGATGGAPPTITVHFARFRQNLQKVTKSMNFLEKRGKNMAGLLGGLRPP